MLRIFCTNKLVCNIFSGMAEKITGRKPEPTEEPQNAEELILLGVDADNPFASELYLEGRFSFPNLRSGSDEYFICSRKDGRRKILFLNGGRLRSLLYAVYDYFERLGCAYFWDEDIIPHLKSLPLEDFNVKESPRFEYRGTRYFAHRSLHRFQAEHWDLDDWKKEIDWLLKKRLNMFMLRIGQDDLFQKAFPGQVPYPGDGEKAIPAFPRGFNDRTHFWSLEERGKLRKALLEYALERDLIHPEDTGTMTHWYSPTPDAFLEKVNPGFIPQAGSAHSGRNLSVWDIREEENMERYFQLTQTHIDCYGGPPHLFHTIGLAERGISRDPEENLRWKFYAYRRIIDELRKHYPDTPLLIASWDMYNAHWSFEAVRSLIDSLNPENCIFFDYTSDSQSEKDSFLNWSVYKRFPWIFGIFQAYESGSDLRGNYKTIKRRLAMAKEDPFCKGMVIWPENSHGDTLMYEYFAANAWNPVFLEIRDFIPVFCRKRYPGNSEQMTKIWNLFLPVIECGAWGVQYGESFAHLEHGWKWTPITELSFKEYPECRENAEKLKPAADFAPAALRALAQLNAGDTILRRDIIDLARTAAARLFQYLYFTVTVRHLEQKDTAEILSIMRELLNELTGILAASPDFSLNDTLDQLKKGKSVNPAFEETLKGNAENDYCRSFIYELCEACYKKELDLFAKQMQTGFYDRENYERIRNDFYAEPLEKYRPDHSAASAKLPETILHMAELAEHAAAVT